MQDQDEKQEIWKKIVDNPEYKKMIDRVPPHEKKIIESTLHGPFLEMLVSLQRLVDRMKKNQAKQSETMRAAVDAGQLVNDELTESSSPSEG